MAKTVRQIQADLKEADARYKKLLDTITTLITVNPTAVGIQKQLEVCRHLYDAVRIFETHIFIYIESVGDLIKSAR